MVGAEEWNSDSLVPMSSRSVREPLRMISAKGVPAIHCDTITFGELATIAGTVMSGWPRNAAANMRWLLASSR
jgi:hypothetical protein